MLNLFKFILKKNFFVVKNVALYKFFIQHRVEYNFRDSFKHTRNILKKI